MNCLRYFNDSDFGEKSVVGWKHIWDAPDGSFKGQCGNCGFIHFFIEGHDNQYSEFIHFFKEGHDNQYKFCPQCGEQKG
jgi:ribosomal protein S27AE